jgi:hypothetical protein
MGCKVYVMSDKRKTLATAGLPDRLVSCQRKGLFWAHEFKAEGEKQSPKQREFQERWQAAGLVYLLGGYDVAHAFLVEQGIIRG